jgi:hypothetical protein
MCDTCETSRRLDPKGRARFEAAAPEQAALWGVPVEQVLCAGYAADAQWARMAALGKLSTLLVLDGPK